MRTCCFTMHIQVCCSCFMFAYLCFALKVTEISKTSVVMYVSDHFVYGKLQLAQYRLISYYDI